MRCRHRAVQLHFHGSPSAADRHGRLAAHLVLAFATVLAAPARAGEGVPDEPGDVPGPLPAVTVLDALAHEGTRWTAPPPLRDVGRVVAPAGDVDADGRGDLVVTAPGDEDNAGGAWVILGDRSPRATGDLDEDPRAIALLPGSDAAGYGEFAAGAGDVNGDGRDDVLVGHAPAGDAAGAVWLVLGPPPRVALEEAREFGRAVRVNGPAGTGFGRAGTGAGDLDGDGFDDVALAAPDTGAGAGRVWILRGGTWPAESAGDIDVTALPDDRALTLDGPDPDARFGAALAGASDLDGDGLDDLAIGAPGVDSGRGAVLLLFGSPGPAGDAAPADGGLDRFTIRRLEAPGAEPGAGLGTALRGGLDVDGDGRPDLVAGAPGRSGADGAPEGRAYWLPGGAGLRTDGELALPGPRGTELRGPPGAAAGSAVALVPDLDGDGRAEVLVGAPEKDLGLGSAYLLYGSAQLPAALELEALHPDAEPRGARFLAGAPGAHLGAALAGRREGGGDGRGALAFGAPGLPVEGRAGAGAVFEVRAPAGGLAPLRLSCRELPGGRVELVWHVDDPPPSVSVLRDGERVAGPLPGHVLRWIDTSPGPGPHEYVVEPDGAPERRSGICRTTGGRLAPQQLICRAVPGRDAVLVRWRNVDTYEALEVEVDGELRAELPGSADRVVLEVASGPHELRVVARPGDAAASCTVEAGLPPLPALDPLTCAPGENGAVRIDWAADPAYALYELLRDGLPVARVEAPPYLDRGAPAGPARWEVRGIAADGRVGPASFCDGEVPPPAGDTILRGRVVHGDPARTPVARGRVELLGADGDIVGVAQPEADGRFAIGIAGEGKDPRRLRYAVRLGPPDGEPRAFALPARQLVAEAPVDDPAAEARLVLPLPVLAAAPERAGRERWEPLSAALEAGVPLAGVELPAGIGPGALALDGALIALRAHLEAELGAAPEEVDLVAFGAAGLAARLTLHARTRAGVRRLVLLGSPNRGRGRALAEMRRDLPARPPRGLPPAEPERWGAAAEEAPAVAEAFNQRVRSTRGAEPHLVAGTGGPRVLDSVLGCSEHDGRVCEESALGGVPDAVVHRVEDDHTELGRSGRSLGVLLDRIGLGEPAAPGGGARAPPGEEAPARGAGAGAGGAEGSSYPGSGFYDGVLGPGERGRLPLHSDTSGSIIIILRTELPGGILFSLLTPEGESIDPASAAAQGVTYETHGDGEGGVVQAYRIPDASPGEWTALLENPSATDSVDYRLELFVESALEVGVEVTPPSTDPGEVPRIAARLRDAGLPVPGAEVRAEVLRPDGGLEVLSLRDDGTAPDDIADDGTYTALPAAGEVPGLHLVEVTAADPDDGFVRTARASWTVRSDAAELGQEWSSGVEDADDDGAFDLLWIEGSVEAERAGVYLVAGRIEGPDGTRVAEPAALLELAAGETAPARLEIPAGTLRLAAVDGPWALAEVELIDVTADFVQAGITLDAHVTEAWAWRRFGIGAAPPFRRGDTDGNGEVDISDAIAALDWLFGDGVGPGCLDAVDANADARIDVSDPVRILGVLFRGGVAMPAPWPECGVDPRLGCAEPPPCP